MNQDYVEEDVVFSTLRFLGRPTDAQGSTGKTILTAIYLGILAVCFITPFIYFFRMRCYMRNHQELQNAMDRAAEQAPDVSSHHGETRAMRKKYRENRRAQIKQLIAPVSKVLTKEDFPHLKNTEPSSSSEQSGSKEELGNITKDVTVESSSDENDLELNDIELGPDPSMHDDELEQETLDFENPYAAELTFVELPPPGLSVLNGSRRKEGPPRLTPNLCAICLASYEVGDNVSWSSNTDCEHAFHVNCIERWLMKQRGSPLCPCCRRDFVVDPYDLGEEESVVAALSMTPETELTIVTPRDVASQQAVATA